MSSPDGMSPLERLVESDAIHRLKGVRDHAVDRKDWVTYASLHTGDYVAMSIASDPIVGGDAAAKALSIQLANVTTVHHSHTPVIDFQDRDHATGVWAMEDNLFWWRDGERQWLRGYGFYHETYVRGDDGQWRFSYRKLVRTHAETSPGAAIMSADFSGENSLVGVGKDDPVPSDSPADRNVATVRRFMAATGHERRAERRGLLHADFVVHEAGGLPFSGDYRGAAGFFELMSRIDDVLDLAAGPITVDPLGDETVAARFRLTFTARTSGETIEMGLVEIYTLRGDRIAELDVYYKDPGALAALLTRAGSA